MYLKKLDIKGFKSFADITEIHFFPGINVIVGPNGCGKSNIVDTVRWVLGESNVRNLRGQRNEDIIFSGTDQKRALGMANVTMVIDNADQGLPSEFSEVAVGRKVFRNGESEFYVNKSRVRLKDVGGLFAGTGLGKKGYSIIGQGELEQVLNGQPFDRRLILEEASGIIKYRQQRDEVISRMEATGNDMEKLETYLAGLGERREELADKAARARDYMEKRAALQECQKAVLEHESAETQRKYQEKSAELTAMILREEQTCQKIQTAQENERQREAHQEQLRHKIAELREQRHMLEKSLGQLDAESRVQQERLKNASQRVISLTAESERYQRQQNRLEADIAQGEEEFLRASSERLEQNAALQQVEADLITLQSSLQAYEAEIEAYRASQEASRRQEEAWNGKNQALRDQLIEVEEVRRRAVMYIEETIRRERAVMDRTAALQKDREQLDSEIQKLQTELALLNRSREQLQEELARVGREYKARQDKRREAASRLALIEDQDRNYAGYSEDVKGLLRDQESHRHSLPGIVGTVGSLIEVPAGLEQAIDVAGGRALEDIVMESELDARRAIHYIKEKGLGRITFLPLDLLKSSPLPADLVKRISSLPGVIGLASDLIKYHPQYHKAIEYMFGRVVIVEDLNRAVEVFRSVNYGLRIVSLEGDILNASGAMTGGKARRVRQSPLIRAAEKRQLEALLQTMDQELGALQAAGTEVETRLGHEQRQAEKLTQEHAGQETRRAVLLQELGSLAAELEASRRQAREHQAEQEACHKRSAGLEDEISELQIKLAELQESQAGKQDDQERLNSLVDEIKRDIAVRQERREAFGQQDLMKNRELEHIAGSLQQYRQQYEQNRQAINNIKEQLLQVVQDTEKMQHQGAAAADSAAALRQQLDAAIKEFETVNGAERGGLEALQMHRASLISLRQEQQEQAAISRALQMNIVRLEAELEGLADRWLESLNQDMPAQVVSPHQAREIREYRVKIRELNERLDEIGPVDLDAIPAYEEINQRFEFVSSQYNDLVEARQGLSRLLRETETIMMREFEGFLVEAGASFKRTFIEIFNGGEASLVMNDSSDRLQAGIDIVVKLPGKKVQSLNLLSGGERALTCIAFIFALLRLKPAPFCLLDEIDAALDESNLLKFTRFLRRLAGTIQFLVITHRQLTIESGDCIYGVTMPQAGVSRVYSLKAEEAVEIAV